MHVHLLAHLINVPIRVILPSKEIKRLVQIGMETSSLIDLIRGAESYRDTQAQMQDLNTSYWVSLRHYYAETHCRLQSGSRALSRASFHKQGASAGAIFHLKKTVQSASTSLGTFNPLNSKQENATTEQEGGGWCSIHERKQGPTGQSPDDWQADKPPKHHRRM